MRMLLLLQLLGPNFHLAASLAQTLNGLYDLEMLESMEMRACKVVQVCFSWYHPFIATSIRAKRILSDFWYWFIRTILIQTTDFYEF